MQLDPSLAFTAVIEMRPGLADPRGEIRGALADAMESANPADRWAFAREWLDQHYPLPGKPCRDCHAMIAHEHTSRPEPTLLTGCTCEPVAGSHRPGCAWAATR